MNDFLTLMFLPFLACVILTGIHGYLGFHVLKRQIIFVDLATAQVAALGSTFGFLLGFPLHTTGSYLISLLATIVFAGALSQIKSKKLPMEAIIGLIYAVASSAAILILSISAEAGEELRSLLVGHLLFVDWPEIIKILMIYLIVGFIHFKYRQQFIEVSSGRKESRLWDFIFYALFGVVVTSSVEISGVLLVFAFLIAPPIFAKMFCSSWGKQLILAWCFGAILSGIGVALSYYWDLPTGAVVVCTLGMGVLFSGISKILLLSNSKI